MIGYPCVGAIVYEPNAILNILLVLIQLMLTMTWRGLEY